MKPAKSIFCSRHDIALIKEIEEDFEIRKGNNDLMFTLVFKPYQ